MWLPPKICETVGNTSNILFTTESIYTKNFSGQTGYKLDMKNILFCWSLLTFFSPFYWWNHNNFKSANRKCKKVSYNKHHENQTQMKNLIFLALIPFGPYHLWSTKSCIICWSTIDRNVAKEVNGGLYTNWLKILK